MRTSSGSIPLRIPSLIEIFDLRVQLGGKEILRVDHFPIEQGMFLGIFGPNGAGKSTFIKAILQLLPNHGEVHYKGHCLHCNSASLEEIGYLPQSVQFDRTLPLTVREFLLMCLRPRFLWFSGKGTTLAQVESTLDRVQARHLLDKALGGLSGGEFQRVLLAQSLLKKPRVLILDEPTTGLDIEADKVLMQLLRNLNREGVTLLMVSHDVECLYEHCSHILGLNHCIRIFDETKNLDMATLVRETFFSQDSLLHELFDPNSPHSHDHAHPHTHPHPHPKKSGGVGA